MSGLLLLVLAALYVAIALYVSLRLAKPMLAKVILILVFALVPSADAIYGRAEMNRLCTLEGGVKVQKTINDVDGVYSARLAESLVALHGFKFSERNEDGQLVRITKGRDGKLVKSKVDVRLSAYEHVFSRNEINYMIVRHLDAVRELSSGEVLGTFIDLHFYGGWVEQSWDGLFGQKIRRAHCAVGNMDVGDARLITKVLAPSK